MRFFITIIAVMMLLPMLSGCLAVAAGTGAYYVGKDERSFGVIVDDGVITSRVNIALIKEEMVKTFDIDVDTDQGVVTLYGKVDSAARAELVVSVTKSVVGVKKVVSKLSY